MNRLKDSTSPYLRQHAANPVNWYEWGNEPFEVAEKERKLVFLSIGYSSCHWCHVMMHESFEDPETAMVLNTFFICVKVDREERPDIDDVYMHFIQVTTGRGGWPLNVFLTPDRKPIFGGTYFPKDRAINSASFKDICRQMAAEWAADPDGIRASSNNEVEFMSKNDLLNLPKYQRMGSGFDDRSWKSEQEDTLSGCIGELVNSFDREWGGFSVDSGPKFPSPMNLDLLLRAYVKEKNGQFLDVVTFTLDAMIRGGIHDHLGGGFARYSTDRFWRIPHFEKMLHDQALLILVLIHTYQVTGNSVYKKVAEETIEYVIRDLGSNGNLGQGVYSSEDADSEGIEGRFYSWKAQDIERVLGELAPEFIKAFNVSADGNFEGDKNVLYMNSSCDLVAILDDLNIEKCKKMLFDERNNRPRPFRDDKVVAEWNALFLWALSKASVALQRPDWLDLAVNLGSFLSTCMKDEKGRWQRSRSSDGKLSGHGFASDYATLALAFLSLYEATGRAEYLKISIDTIDQLIELFWCDLGGVYTNSKDSELLIQRKIHIIDGALPSANSIVCYTLLKLSNLKIKGNSDNYREKADAILKRISPVLVANGTMFGCILCCMDTALSSPVEIVITQGDNSKELVAEFHSKYLPNSVLLWGDRISDSELMEGRENKSHAVAYVCADMVCLAPVTDVKGLQKVLGAL